MNEHPDIVESITFIGGSMDGEIIHQPQGEIAPLLQIADTQEVYGCYLLVRHGDESSRIGYRYILSTLADKLVKVQH